MYKSRLTPAHEPPTSCRVTRTSSSTDVLLERDNLTRSRVEEAGGGATCAPGRHVLSHHVGGPLRVSFKFKQISPGLFTHFFSRKGAIHRRCPCSPGWHITDSFVMATPLETHRAILIVRSSPVLPPFYLVLANQTLSHQLTQGLRISSPATDLLLSHMSLSQEQDEPKFLVFHLRRPVFPNK